MNVYVKGALIAGGVLVGGFVLWQGFKMVTAPSLPDNAGAGAPLPAPGAPLNNANRAGESDATAIGRVAETAIDRVSQGYQTYTTQVSQANREREARAAAQAAQRGGGLSDAQAAARNAKLRG